MTLLLVGLIVLISGTIGWVLGVAYAHRGQKVATQKHLAGTAQAGKPTRDEYLRTGSRPPPEILAATGSRVGGSPAAERSSGTDESTPKADGPGEALKELIASVQAHEVRVKPGGRSDGRIEHLLVTRNGDRWVVDQLPRDDYADFDEAPLAVDQLISRPAGYRLVRGYNLLQDEDLDEREEP